MPKILIVEDDNDINQLLYDMLAGRGYSVQSAYSGTEALLYMRSEEWDMVLLDLMLPGKTGEEVLVELRKGKNMPVLVISAKEESRIKIEMLRAGADDFITKPFDIEEVLARVESNLRRYLELGVGSKEKSEVLTYKEISLDLETREVKANGQVLGFTAREFDILELLMNHPKKVFSKGNLFESIWKEDYLGDDNTINVHISNIRNKLIRGGAKEDYIQTIWGIGYKLET